MSDSNHADQAASGVAELIDQLRLQGIEAGEEEGRKKIQTAEQEANRILVEAQAKADKLLQEAKKEAEQIRHGGHEALAIAMRDIVLKLKAKLSETVGEKVQHLIAHQLDQDTFLQQLILQVASRVRRDTDLDSSAEITVSLPEKLIGLEELRHNPLELKEGSLSHFILSIAADVLREGVTFAQSDRIGKGITLYLKDQDVQVDLTDDRLTQVLLEHLQPRFRAILEGMVK